MNELAPVAKSISLTHSEQLDRFEILRTYKELFVGKDGANHSPFSDHRVVRYDTEVLEWDVPEIHQQAREILKSAVCELRQGRSSKLMVLAGAPGTGKSHLLNYFRSPRVETELGHLVVKNNNHWRIDEFEACLLTSLAERIAERDSSGRSLLQARIEDVAFQALTQILDEPGKIREYLGGDFGFVSRLWWRLGPDRTAKIRDSVRSRDVEVFRMLHFEKFAAFVCDRFLHRRDNPFHRYVLHVLLRFLFEEDRSWVLAWLIGQRVHPRFHDILQPGQMHSVESRNGSWLTPDVEKRALAVLGIADAVDANYKVMEVIRILISLFSLDLDRSGPSSSGRVFFFAFDQVEGRNELFEQDAEWMKFFAKLSEFYNSLPNLLIVFTMTTGSRDRLYHKMELQFQQRILRDQRLFLSDVSDDEVLAVYRHHVERWRRGRATHIEAMCATPDFAYLPFTAREVVDKAKQLTLRQMLDRFDADFRVYMNEQVTSKVAMQDFLVAFNEEKRNAEKVKVAKYVEAFAQDLKTLFDRESEAISQSLGLILSDSQVETTENGNHPAVRLQLRKADQEKGWIRVYFAVLPGQYKQRAQNYADFLNRKDKTRYQLWMFRPEKLELQAIENERPGQIFGRVLEVDSQTRVKSLLHLLDKASKLDDDATASEDDRDRYRSEVLQIVAEESRKLPLWEILETAAKALDQAAGSLEAPEETVHART